MLTNIQGSWRLVGLAIVTNAHLRCRCPGSSLLCNAACQGVCEPATSEHKGHGDFPGALCFLKVPDVVCMYEAEAQARGRAGFAEVPRKEIRVCTSFFLRSNVDGVLKAKSGWRPTHQWPRGGHRAWTIRSPTWFSRAWRLHSSHMLLPAKVQHATSSLVSAHGQAGMAGPLV